MTISNCSGMCWKDDDTGETFCPPCGWVMECPKKSCSQSRAYGKGGETYNENDCEKDEEGKDYENED